MLEDKRLKVLLTFKKAAALSAVSSEAVEHRLYLLLSFNYIVWPLEKKKSVAFRWLVLIRNLQGISI